MEYSKALLVVILLVIAGVCFMLFVLPFTGTSSSFNQAPPPPSITVLHHSGAIDTGSGTYIVTGTAKNTGTVPVVKVYIVVTTYDASGAEIGSTYDALLNLNPNDEAPFRVETRPYYQGTSIARYNIVPNYNPVPNL